MARKPRIYFPGAIYHVILRGNDGLALFSEDSDRRYLYALIEEGVDRYGHSIHAFCLMTNHIHLVVQVADVSLSKIIQNISFRFSRYINRKTGRTGHLFQGRYRAILVDADNYLMELVRYIHNNPLRAGLVTDPGKYNWSSHRAYLNEEKHPWLTQKLVLSRFDISDGTARRRLHEFCVAKDRENLDDEIHSGTIQGRILGDEKFAEKALKLVNEPLLAQIGVEPLIRAVCVEFDTDPEKLAAPGKKRPEAIARSTAAYLTREMNGPSLTELAIVFKRDVATLSRSANGFRDRMQLNPGLRESVKRVKDVLERMSKCQA